MGGKEEGRDPGKSDRAYNSCILSTIPDIHDPCNNKHGREKVGWNTLGDFCVLSGGCFGEKESESKGVDRYWIVNEGNIDMDRKEYGIWDMDKLIYFGL